jgi:hypothetical protein
MRSVDFFQWKKSHVPAGEPPPSGRRKIIGGVDSEVVGPRSPSEKKDVPGRDVVETCALDTAT